MKIKFKFNGILHTTAYNLAKLAAAAPYVLSFLMQHTFGDELYEHESAMSTF